jgi:hypothetical protein
MICSNIAALKPNRLLYLATTAARMRHDRQLSPLRPAANLFVGMIAICIPAVVAISSAESAAAPPSPELARKCREMMVKAYPPVPAGNPKGAARAERDYFQKCIANRGEVKQ